MISSKSFDMCDVDDTAAATTPSLAMSVNEGNEVGAADGRASPLNISRVTHDNGETAPVRKKEHHSACFGGASEVAMGDDGLQTRRADMLKIGDKVYSPSQGSGVLIVAITKSLTSHYCILNGLPITSTHPVHTREGWSTPAEIGTRMYAQPPMTVFNVVLQTGGDLRVNGWTLVTLGPSQTQDALPQHLKHSLFGTEEIIILLQSLPSWPTCELNAETFDSFQHLQTSVLKEKQHSPRLRRWWTIRQDNLRRAKGQLLTFCVHRWRSNTAARARLWSGHQYAYTGLTKGGIRVLETLLQRAGCRATSRLHWVRASILTVAVLEWRLHTMNMRGYGRWPRYGAARAGCMTLGLCALRCLQYFGLVLYNTTAAQSGPSTYVTHSPRWHSLRSAQHMLETLSHLKPFDVWSPCYNYRYHAMPRSLNRDGCIRSNWRYWISHQDLAQTKSVMVSNITDLILHLQAWKALGYARALRTRIRERLLPPPRGGSRDEAQDKRRKIIAFLLWTAGEEGFFPADSRDHGHPSIPRGWQLHPHKEGIWGMDWSVVCHLDALRRRNVDVRLHHRLQANTSLHALLRAYHSWGLEALGAHPRGEETPRSASHPRVIQMTPPQDLAGNEMETEIVMLERLQENSNMPPGLNLCRPKLNPHLYLILTSYGAQTRGDGLQAALENLPWLRALAPRTDGAGGWEGPFGIPLLLPRAPHSPMRAHRMSREMADGPSAGGRNPELSLVQLYGILLARIYPQVFDTICTLTFMMISHPRLGELSPLGNLDTEILRRIAQDALRDSTGRKPRRIWSAIREAAPEIMDPTTWLRLSRYSIYELEMIFRIGQWRYAYPLPQHHGAPEPHLSFHDLHQTYREAALDLMVCGLRLPVHPHTYDGRTQRGSRDERNLLPRGQYPWLKTTRWILATLKIAFLPNPSISHLISRLVYPLMFSPESRDICSILQELNNLGLTDGTYRQTPYDFNRHDAILRDWPSSITFDSRFVTLDPNENLSHPQHWILDSFCQHEMGDKESFADSALSLFPGLPQLIISISLHYHGIADEVTNWSPEDIRAGIEHLKSAVSRILLQWGISDFMGHVPDDFMAVLASSGQQRKWDLLYGSACAEATHLQIQALDLSRDLTGHNTQTGRALRELELTSLLAEQIYSWRFRMWTHLALCRAQAILRRNLRLRATQSQTSDCLHGTVLVMLADGTSQQIQHLKAGDELKALHPAMGHAIVRCLITTDCAERTAHLVTLNDGELIITQSHPILQKDADRWIRPDTLARTAEHTCDAVYNLVLDANHYCFFAGGSWCLSLGHSLLTPGTYHPYFASAQILQDIANLNGFEKGALHFKPNNTLRSDDGRVTGLDPAKLHGPLSYFHPDRPESVVQRPSAPQDEDCQIISEPRPAPEDPPAQGRGPRAPPPGRSIPRKTHAEAPPLPPGMTLVTAAIAARDTLFTALRAQGGFLGRWSSWLLYYRDHMPDSLCQKPREAFSHQVIWAIRPDDRHVLTGGIQTSESRQDTDTPKIDPYLTPTWRPSTLTLRQELSIIEFGARTLWIFDPGALGAQQWRLTFRKLLQLFMEAFPIFKDPEYQRRAKQRALSLQRRPYELVTGIALQYRRLALNRTAPTFPPGTLVMLVHVIDSERQIAWAIPGISHGLTPGGNKLLVQPLGSSCITETSTNSLDRTFALDRCQVGESDDDEDIHALVLRARLLCLQHSTMLKQFAPPELSRHASQYGPLSPLGASHEATLGMLQRYNQFCGTTNPQMHNQTCGTVTLFLPLSDHIWTLGSSLLSIERAVATKLGLQWPLAPAVPSQDVPATEQQPRLEIGPSRHIPYPDDPGEPMDGDERPTSDEETPDMEDQVSSHQLHLSKRLYQSLHTLFEAFFFGDSRSNSRTRGCSLLGIQLFPHQARELDDMTNDALLRKLIESAIDPEHRHAPGALVPDSCCEFPVASGRWWSPQMKDKPSSGHNLSFDPLAKALRRSPAGGADVEILAETLTALRQHLDGKKQVLKINHYIKAGDTVFRPKADPNTSIQVTALSLYKGIRNSLGVHCSPSRIRAAFPSLEGTVTLETANEILQSTRHACDLSCTHPRNVLPYLSRGCRLYFVDSQLQPPAPASSPHHLPASEAGAETATDAGPSARKKKKNKETPTVAPHDLKTLKDCLTADPHRDLSVVLLQLLWLAHLKRPELDLYMHLRHQTSLRCLISSLCPPTRQETFSVTLTTQRHLVPTDVRSKQQGVPLDLTCHLLLRDGACAMDALGLFQHIIPTALNPMLMIDPKYLRPDSRLVTTHRTSSSLVPLPRTIPLASLILPASRVLVLPASQIRDIDRSEETEPQITIHLAGETSVELTDVECFSLEALVQKAFVRLNTTAQAALPSPIDTASWDLWLQEDFAEPQNAESTPLHPQVTVHELLWLHKVKHLTLHLECPSSSVFRALWLATADSWHPVVLRTTHTVERLLSMVQLSSQTHTALYEGVELDPPQPPPSHIPSCGKILVMPKMTAAGSPASLPNPDPPSTAPDLHGKATQGGMVLGCARALRGPLTVQSKTTATGSRTWQIPVRLPQGGTTILSMEDTSSLNSLYLEISDLTNIPDHLFFLRAGGKVLERTHVSLTSGGFHNHQSLDLILRLRGGSSPDAGQDALMEEDSEEAGACTRPQKVVLQYAHGYLELLNFLECEAGPDLETRMARHLECLTISQRSELFQTAAAHSQPVQVQAGDALVKVARLYPNTWDSVHRRTGANPDSIKADGALAENFTEINLIPYFENLKAVTQAGRLLRLNSQGQEIALSRGGVDEEVDIVQLNQISCGNKRELVDHLKTLKQLTPYLKSGGKPCWKRSIEFTENSAEPWEKIGNGYGKLLISRSENSIALLEQLISQNRSDGISLAPLSQCYGPPSFSVERHVMFRSEDDGDGSDAWLPDPDLVLDPATPPDADVYEIVVRTLLAMGLSGDHIQTLIRFILLADHGIQGVAQIWPEYGRNIANVFSKAQRGRRGKLELHLDGAFHPPSKRREVMINFSAFFCNRILKSPSAPLPALLQSLQCRLLLRPRDPITRREQTSAASVVLRPTVPDLPNYLQSQLERLGTPGQGSSKIPALIERQLGQHVRDFLTRLLPTRMAPYITEDSVNVEITQGDDANITPYSDILIHFSPTTMDNQEFTTESCIILALQLGFLVGNRATDEGYDTLHYCPLRSLASSYNGRPDEQSCTLKRISWNPMYEPTPGPRLQRGRHRYIPPDGIIPGKEIKCNMLIAQLVRRLLRDPACLPASTVIKLAGLQQKPMAKHHLEKSCNWTHFTPLPPMTLHSPPVIEMSAWTRLRIPEGLNTAQKLLGSLDWLHGERNQSGIPSDRTRHGQNLPNTDHLVSSFLQAPILQCASSSALTSWLPELKTLLEPDNAQIKYEGTPLRQAPHCLQCRGEMEIGVFSPDHHLCHCLQCISLVAGHIALSYWTACLHHLSSSTHLETTSTDAHMQDPGTLQALSTEDPASVWLHQMVQSLQDKPQHLPKHEDLARAALQTSHDWLSTTLHRVRTLAQNHPEAKQETALIQHSWRLFLQKDINLMAAKLCRWPQPSVQQSRRNTIHTTWVPTSSLTDLADSVLSRDSTSPSDGHEPRRSTRDPAHTNQWKRQKGDKCPPRGKRVQGQHRDKREDEMLPPMAHRQPPPAAAGGGGT